ncbi:MAG: single-stranded DNA-binding protein [Bacteroidales bacterium]|jgi:single-strand DNA-binding protein|nr:single-stranded DNA-binding protein [Bacteroidales bacterium]
MNLRNRVQLIGNLGSVPVIKNFESGNKLTRFTLATSDVYKKDNKYVKDTQWHIIVAWGKIAEIAEKNLTTGSEVVIDGRLTQRSYTDKNGTKQYITEVVANTILCRGNSYITERTMNSIENRA